MRIGVDIDRVLANLEQYVLDNLSRYCVVNNIDYTIGKIYYDHCKTFNISKKDENDFWNIYLEVYAKEEKARPYAAEVIKKLKEEGHEIYIITARWLTNRDDDVGMNMRGLVQNWLQENDIVYDKLIFSKSSKENKFDEIVENKIDLMIEDSSDNINNLAKIIPVICYDTKYNKECCGDNIIRCYSWYDIYNKIGEFKN